MNPLNYKYTPFIIALVASIFLSAGIGSVHLFDWDEINFAESAREMILTHDYLTVQINFKPFWEKPPLFFWLQAGSMQLFGINEFAARFPNVIFGFLTLITLFSVGKRYAGQRFGLLWMLVYIGSFLPQIYFKTSIIDPVFNYFIFMSLVCYVEAIHEVGRPFSFSLLSGLFAGLSFLTKGPVGILLIVLCVLVNLVSTKGRGFPALKLLFGMVTGFLLPAMIWISAELYFHGAAFLQKFLIYQIELFTKPVASHGQPFYYHFIVVLIGCFPMSIVALAAFNKRFHSTHSFSRWMKILFWVVIILFSLSKTKIVHYSSMTWLPLSYLAACVLHEGKVLQYNIQKILYWMIGGIISLAMLFSTLFFHYPSLWLHYVKDAAFVASYRQMMVPMVLLPVTGLVFTAGLVYAYFLAVKSQPLKSVVVWALTQTGVITALYYLLLPSIESLSQGPLITLVTKVKNEPALIYTYGFKSYAHFYYGERTVANSSNEYLPAGQLAADESSRLIYYISKEPNHELDTVKGFQLMMKEGGYRLYKREPLDN